MRHLTTLAILLLTLTLVACGDADSSASSGYSGKGVKALPDFTFADIKGVNRSSSEWQGKVLVVNFWATWCPPCREEMPLLIETQEQYTAQGVQVISIAVDNPQRVEEFAEVYGINFPVLLGDIKAMELAALMGNSFNSLPFTAIYDQNGKTRYAQAGMLQEETLKRELTPLL